MRTTLLAFVFALVAVFAAPHGAEAAACTANSSAGANCTTANGAAGKCGFDEFGTPVCNPTGGSQPCTTTINGQSVSGTIDPTTGQCVAVSPSGPTNGTPITLINPLKSGTSLSSFLTMILQFVIKLGTIAIILMLVYVGYLFVAAQGNPAKISAARQALLWTVVGGLILLGSQAIATAIQATVTAIGG